MGGAAPAECLRDFCRVICGRGRRRVHHTERSKWRHTFRGLAADALAALGADNPEPAQRAVAKMVDLACDMRSYDYFHPVFARW